MAATQKWNYPRSVFLDSTSLFWYDKTELGVIEMTRKVRSRVVNSSPFIERRRARRGSAATQTPLRRATDDSESGRNARTTAGDTTYPAFTSTARPHDERSSIGRKLDFYA